MNRALIWSNLCMGSYVGYKLGIMACSWIYRQLNYNPNTMKIPKWFMYSWISIMTSNVVVLATCASISLILGNLDAMKVYDSFFDVVSVFVTVVFFIACSTTAFNLHKLIVRRMVVAKSATTVTSEQDDSNSQIRQQLSGTSGTSATGSSDGNQITEKDQRSLKMLYRARNKLFFVSCVFIIGIPVTR